MKINDLWMFRKKVKGRLVRKGSRQEMWNYILLRGVIIIIIRNFGIIYDGCIVKHLSFLVEYSKSLNIIEGIIKSIGNIKENMIRNEWLEEYIWLKNNTFPAWIYLTSLLNLEYTSDVWSKYF